MRVLLAGVPVIKATKAALLAVLVAVLVTGLLVTAVQETTCNLRGGTFYTFRGCVQEMPEEPGL